MMQVNACSYWRVLLLCFVLLAYHVVANASESCTGDITTAEYDALKSLYDSTGGADWKWNTTSTESKWVFPSSLAAPCRDDWYGITCFPSQPSPTASPCSIYSLNLTHFGLTGRIPSAIGDLVWLTNLSLAENNIFGEVPATISSIHQLQGLYLFENLLLGTIPEPIFGLSQLLVLRLHRNFFEGSISTNISQLTNLIELDLSSNRLSLSIPSTVSYLTSLQYLYLYDNLLSQQIPTEIGLLTQLLQMQINENILGGSLPTEICAMNSLVSLHLYNNLMHGNMPNCFGNMKYLQDLLLYDNIFTGTIPTEWCQLANNSGGGSSLQQINIGTNRLTGSIPSCIGNFSSVQLFDVHLNHLTGTFPTEIGFLSSISILNIQQNSIYSSIPISICNCSQLLEISAATNLLSQSIPFCLRRMESIFNFDVSGNYFSGPLLDTAINPLMITFAVYTNYLTGTIPATIGLMSSVTQFMISYNMFSGSIPFGVGSLSSITLLELDDNFLTGTFPDMFFQNLTELNSFYAQGNQLMGTLPPLLNASQLQFIDLANNYLTGSIPAEYISDNIQTLYLNSNQLTGDVNSFDWTVIANAVSVGLNNNLFTGDLSVALSPTDVVSYIDNGSSNSSSFIEAFTINNNFLFGEFPDALCGWFRLEYLQIGALYLSGTIPSCLANLNRIESLNMSNNLLTGSVTDIFANSSALPVLAVIDISVNGFTGAVPSQLFAGNPARSRLLDGVLLYTNCFQPSLPTEICDAANLTTVIFDSMSTAPTCRLRFGVLSSIIKVTISNIVSTDNTIPSCIWEMTEMRTIHLSGNGLAGTLQDFNIATSKLLDVSLASNRLVGSIPLSWQQWGQFSQLDLSSNKLSGTLDPQSVIFANNTNIDLTVNRLSGKIPAAYVAAPNVNILTGNLFECTESTMPQSDPNKAEYVCGSDDLDISLIVFAVVLVLCGACYAWYIHHTQDKKWDPFTMTTVRKWSFSTRLIILRLAKLGVPVQQIDLFSGFIEVCSRWTSLMCALYVAIAMSLYILLKTNFVPNWKALYSTHAEQYAWLTTAAYAHGIAPVVIVLVFIGLGLALLRWVLCRFEPLREDSCSWLSWLISFGRNESSKLAQQQRSSLARESFQRDTQPKNIDMENANSTMNQTDRLVALAATCSALSVVVVIVLAHMVVTVAINVAYVYILIRGVFPSLLLFIQVLLSLFKLLWNQFFVRRSMAFTSVSDSLQLYCQTLMTLFTFLMSPIIATFFVDFTCFRYIVLGQPSVTTSFGIVPFSCHLVCHASTNAAQDECFNHCSFTGNLLVSASSSVVPSWLYSYQCSSSILTNYVPVLVFAYVISGMIFPLCRLVLVNYILFPVPPVLRHSPSLSSTVPDKDSAPSASSSSVSSDSRPIQASLSRSVLNYVLPEQSPLPLRLLRISSRDSLAVSVKHELFAHKLNSIVCKICLNIAVMFSFALACPLLSIAVLVDSWSLLAKWAVNLHQIADFVQSQTQLDSDGLDINKKQPTLVTTSVLHSNSASIVTPEKMDVNTAVSDKYDIGGAIAAECTIVLNGLGPSLWLVVVFTFAFWSFFFFDMIGDVYGSAAGAWMTAITIAWTVGCYSTSRFCYSFLFGQKKMRPSEVSEGALNDSFL